MMKRLSAWVATSVGLIVFGLLPSAWAEAPKIVSVVRIWDRAPHNAFTDLIRWQNVWYCTFREADAHVGGDGKLRVLESTDGKTWSPRGLVQEDGVDLRDPHLSVTADDRLMIVAGGSVYRGTKTLVSRQPRVFFSKDALNWTPSQRVLSEGDWLWRVTWYEGRAYGVVYNSSKRESKGAQQAAKDTKPARAAAAGKLRLVVSEDGVKFDTITQLDVIGDPNETTLRFLPGGELMALVRREGGNSFGWIGTSKPPYRQWQWHETRHRFGGPNFIRLPDGSLWGASRSYAGGPRTVIARISPTSYEPLLTLPSGGDTSYAGLVWHDGLLWVSYYSSHEGKTSIYLAKVRLPQEPFDVGSRLELFVDDFLIDRLDGTARQVLQRPTPREVVLVADRPWEGNCSAYFTVFRDGDLYRMYYRGLHLDDKTRAPAHQEVTCYAESKDGLHWTRPDLGLFAFDGSKKNNIVWTGTGAHNFTPFKDANPQCPADKRYKALAGIQGGLRALKSADGIHWSLMREQAVITRGAFDSQNVAFWDPNLGKYRDYHRAFRGVRDIMTSISEDFLDWTPPAFLDYRGGKWEDLYTNAIRPYERAPHFLLGFPTRFLPAREQTEPTFMASRDGQTFRRWTEAVVPTTAPKNRDGNRSNYLAWGMVVLPGREGELSVYGTEAYFTGPAGRLRRFAYRLDGFVAVHATAERGQLVTKPLRFQGDRLVLNFVTAPRGSVRVELQRADGKPLPGLSLDDCQPLRGDAVAQGVSWGTTADLRRWAGQPVRLCFELKDADLFSFRFQ
jgi:hypothetical protein